MRGMALSVMCTSCSSSPATQKHCCNQELQLQKSLHCSLGSRSGFVGRGNAAPAEQHFPKASKNAVQEPQICIAESLQYWYFYVPKYPPLGFATSSVSNIMISLEKGKSADSYVHYDSRGGKKRLGWLKKR